MSGERRSGFLAEPGVLETLRRALREDIGPGDVTTRALVSPRRMAGALLVTRQACIVAGAPVAAEVFRLVDPNAEIEIRIPDGSPAKAGDTLLTIRGQAAALLMAERTALNFMQRMTGIATMTARFVEAVRPHPVLILDTRKTTPTLRRFEKYAVRCGGGTNHRMGLYDMALLKDNHRFLWREEGRGGLADAVHAIRRRFPGVPVEVEVESFEEYLSGLPARPEWILLDNMDLETMRACARQKPAGVRLEASGGVTLERAPAIAATGVDAISIGALTHSAPAADLSLEVMA